LIFGQAIVACLALNLGGCLSSQKKLYSITEESRIAALPKHAGVVFTRHDYGDIVAGHVGIVREKASETAVYESAEYDDIIFIPNKKQSNKDHTFIMMQARRKSDGKYLYLYGKRSKKISEGGNVKMFRKEGGRLLEFERYYPKGHSTILYNITHELENDNFGKTLRQPDQSYDVGLYGLHKTRWPLGKLHSKAKSGGRSSAVLRVFDLSHPESVKQFEIVKRGANPPPDGELTPRVARDALNKWLVRNCNKAMMLRMAGSGNQSLAVSRALSAIRLSFEPGDDVCTASYDGPYPYTIIFGVSGIGDMQCSGTDRKLCRGRIVLGCDFDYFADSSVGVKHANMMLGGLCRVMQLPWEAELKFRQSRNSGWELEDWPIR